MLLIGLLILTIMMFVDMKDYKSIGLIAVFAFTLYKYMVSGKSLSELSAEQRKKLLFDVYEVYKKYGVEQKLGSPQLVD